MARHKVEITGVNTANIEVLTEEEKVDLIKKMHEGDIFAKDRLINGNLKLVLSVLKQFNNRNENMDDLFQVGCIGLMKSIDNFNIELNVRFSTYAVPMIIGEIRRYLRDNSTIRVSRSMRDTAYRALQAKEAFVREHQREPTMTELAKAMDVPEEDIVFALDAIMDPVSLYEPVFEGNGDTVCVMDQVGDTKNTDEHWLEKIVLNQAMERLPPREQRILTMRFFEGRTQMEVAEEIHISQAQVSRLEKSALDRIRKQI